MNDKDKEITELLKASQDVITKLQSTIKDMRPLAEFGEAVIADDSHYSMKEAADIIAEKLGDKKVGRNKLFKILREIGILCDSDSNWNEPYRNFIDAGHFYTKLVEKPIGMISVTQVTGKGILYILKKVQEYIG